MLRENRIQQFRGETPEALFLAQKLKALTDENLYLERHLSAMVQNNQAVQSMFSKNPFLK